MNFIQRIVVFGLTEAVRRCRKLAIQRVGPGVIWADDSTVFEVTRIRCADAGTAVSAGVVKRADTFLSARNDESLVADFGCDVVALPGQSIFAPDANPVAVPDSVEFALVMIGIEIPMAGNRLVRVWIVAACQSGRFSSMKRFTLSPITARISASVKPASSMASVR